MNQNLSEHENHGHESTHESHNASHHEGHAHTENHTPSQHAPKGGLNAWMIATLVLAGIIVGYAISNFVPPIGTKTTDVNTVVQNAEANKKVAVPDILTPDETKALPDDDPVLGDANAPVTIVEFSDFQCPYCEGFYTDSFLPMKKDFIDSGKVKLVYRDYPLASHPLALAAAHAAACANDQKKFEPMHDILFEKQTEWSPAPKALEVFEGYAKKIGLDVAAYKECMTSQSKVPEIRKDLLDGIAVGVKGTPHFFINGKRIPGSMDYATVFKPAIEAELAGKSWKISGDPLTGQAFVEVQ